jgi:acetyl esterase
MADTFDVDLEAADHSFTIRVYPAPEPSAVLVWAHGGAFLGGSLDMPEADEVARRLVESGVSVVSVGYSLAPADPLLARVQSNADEHLPSREQIEAEIAASGPRVRFPVASLQVLAAFDWAVEHAPELGVTDRRVGLGGASAGGNLTAGVALRVRDRGDRQPGALLLCYPVLHAELPLPNDDLVAALADLPSHGLSPESSRMLNLNYVGDPQALADPYAFPGGHDVRGLPPTLIVTAGPDRLRSSAEAFAAELAVASVDVSIVQERGFAHGFLNEAGNPAALRTVARFARALTDW